MSSTHVAVADSSAGGRERRARQWRTPSRPHQEDHDVGGDAMMQEKVPEVASDPTYFSPEKAQRLQDLSTVLSRPSLCHMMAMVRGTPPGQLRLLLMEEVAAVSACVDTQCLLRGGTRRMS
mmetsp:Transcript_14233/g.36390  ORF Transcript_14233/g.36390 Transcript_14233/m.36390 type:complete len:121 (+) Transcript_14233:49-411(+)|eukprot:CAMPEP_0177667848 /NCGR_PEP_ID=MMETSP0447-20121125/22368_1 /TAXON_ID=0 /ORGANISM="Stygamoeba regulata, Strain BSH-02190019" /LENGTH=120 /DNA_ID=CAMNT_0019174159 /DNA_START=30 /DNA_END=392 /DNA_ORIENTATION=-